MKRGLQGSLITVNTSPEPFKTFIPNDLPPKPPLALDSALHDQLERANRALGRLDGVAMLLPDLSLYLYFYVRREAVLSSQIEGAQSSLSDLLLFENDEVPGVPLDDTLEVSNYASSMEYGLEQIRRGSPLTSRLIQEIHSMLLSKGRGSDQQPGEFRRSQNWIGGTRPGNAAYVPPPHYEIMAKMGELEKFINDVPTRTPSLIKAALSHVQFETIHPFLDGNGRLGRLLITLLLCHEKAVNQPLLYLSLFLKSNREAYYNLLQQVRTEGVWEEWLRFFLRGVEETADQAATMAQRILQMFDSDRRKIERADRSAAAKM